ncbi:hypothetical protein BH11ARM2_BH11ARM2_08910 [soil metagenome]
MIVGRGACWRRQARMSFGFSLFIILLLSVSRLPGKFAVLGGLAFGIGIFFWMRSKS